MGLETNKLYRKDCIKGMAGIKPGSIDLVFADPPFNVGYEYDAYDDRKRYDEYLNWSRQWISAVREVLKPDGTFWLAIGDEYAAELKLIAQNDAGFTCRSWVVWYYTFGINCKNKFSRSHVHLFYFVKNADRFTFNADDKAVRVPSARQLVYADKRANPKGRLPDDTWILRPQDLPDGFGPDEDTWYVPRVCGTFKERSGWHGCQMPEQLLGRIIRACSNEGDCVLDPFAGSGTTLATAKKLGRQWIGYEISEEYARQICDRMDRIKTGDPLDGAEKPLVSVASTSRGRVRGAETRSRRNGRATPPPAYSTKFLNGIEQVFRGICDGLSIDRVIADPAINERFTAECKHTQIPGEPRDWNHGLLGLRKSGRLAWFERPKGTIIPRVEMDEYIDASEMAWQLISSRNNISLDDIFCDPKLAAEFDGVAADLAPGWQPFEYRWAAFRVRKEVARKKGEAKKLPPELCSRRLGKIAIGLDDVNGLPNTGGLYILETATQKIYLGETLKLRDRIERHALRMSSLLSSLGLLDTSPDDVRVRFVEIEDKCRLGMQSKLMGRWIRTPPLANVEFEKQAFTT